MARKLRKIRHFLTEWTYCLPTWLKCVLIILLCFNAFSLWQLYHIPIFCAVCDLPKCHPPCIVDITYGQVGTMYVYDHPYNRLDEISSYQSGGVWEIYYGAGLRMMRSAGSNVSTSFPNNEGYLYPSHFCLSCRRQLREYKNCRYVLVDLFDEGHPVFYPIGDGAEFDIRCYTVTVDVGREYAVTIRGNLEN